MKTLLFGLTVVLVLAAAMVVSLAGATYAEIKGWAGRRGTGGQR